MKNLSRFLWSTGLILLFVPATSFAEPCKSCVHMGGNSWICVSNPGRTGYSTCIEIPGSPCILADSCEIGIGWGDALLEESGLNFRILDPGPCMTTLGASESFDAQGWLEPSPPEPEGNIPAERGLTLAMMIT
jgi:hypothetical protein